jgi:hypothetical protein
MSKAHMHALHSGRSPLSPLPSFSFLSLLSPPLSVLFSKTDLGKRAPGKQPHGGWYGGHLESICGLWARVKHHYCAQKPPNWSSDDAKTQKPTKSTVALKRRKILKDTICVSKDKIYDIVDGWRQRGCMVSCTVEVWPTSFF